LGPQARAQLRRTGLTEGGGPLVGRILEDAPHGAAIPHRLAGARALLGLVQTPSPLPDAQALPPDPGDDLPHRTTRASSNRIS